MTAVNISDLALQEFASAADPTVLVRFNFPVYASSGATNSSVVYFEVEPGKRLATHHDSAEEVLYIVQGDGIATVGEESGQVRAGDLAVIPAWAPHGIENTGQATLKVVGFFGSATMTHHFTEQLSPSDGSLIILHTVDGEAVYVANSMQPPEGA